MRLIMSFGGLKFKSPLSIHGISAQRYAAAAPVLRSAGATSTAAASPEELVFGFEALQKPLPRYWEPEGQEVHCFPCSEHLSPEKSQEREGKVEQHPCALAD